MTEYEAKVLAAALAYGEALKALVSLPRSTSPRSAEYKEASAATEKARNALSNIFLHDADDDEGEDD